MEVVVLPSHIGKRRGLVHFCRRTPDKEVSILIGKEINIETIVQQFHSHVRLMIGKVASHTETLVVSLLTVSFIGEKIHAPADIKITDTTGVGEIESFVNWVSDTTKKTSA